MGTSKCDIYEQLPFIYRLKLYALFINGNYIFLDSDLLYNCALEDNLVTKTRNIVN